MGLAEARGQRTLGAIFPPMMIVRSPVQSRPARRDAQWDVAIIFRPVPATRRRNLRRISETARWERGQGPAAAPRRPISTAQAVEQRQPNFERISILVGRYDERPWNAVQALKKCEHGECLTAGPASAQYVLQKIDPSPARSTGAAAEEFVGDRCLNDRRTEEDAEAHDEADEKPGSVESPAA